MTTSAEYLAEALREIEFVKSEEALLGWVDLWMNTIEYIGLTHEEALELEQAYQRKAGWFMGVLAG